MLDIKHGKNAINLTNIVVLVKTKNQNYWAQTMTICNLSFYIYIQDRYVLLLVLLYQSKFLLHVVHFYRICYPFHDDALIL